MCEGLLMERLCISFLHVVLDEVDPASQHTKYIWQKLSASSWCFQSLQKELCFIAN